MGVDALAVAIGTSHGTYKFEREPGGDVLRMDLIAEIWMAAEEAHDRSNSASTGR